MTAPAAAGSGISHMSRSADRSQASARNLTNTRSAPTVGTNQAKAKVAPRTKVKTAVKAKQRPASFDEQLLPIPHGLQCVICREIFKDPVFTEDGHSYCRGCIQEWFKAHETRVTEFYRVPGNIAPHSRKMPPNLLAPMTQLPLSSRTLQPNIALKQAVEAFCEARPNDEHRERERQNLQKAVEEAKMSEGALKSNYSKEVRLLKGQVENLQEQLGQAKNDLETAKEECTKAQVDKSSFHDPFFELELEELDRDLALCSAEELGIMNLPYTTAQPPERPRFGRPRSHSM